MNHSIIILFVIIVICKKNLIRTNGTLIVTDTTRIIHPSQIMNKSYHNNHFNRQYHYDMIIWPYHMIHSIFRRLREYNSYMLPCEIKSAFTTSSFSKFFFWSIETIPNCYRLPIHILQPDQISYCYFKVHKIRLSSAQWFLIYLRLLD